MKARILAASAVVMSLALAGCATAAPETETPVADGPATINIVATGSLDFSAVDLAKWQENMQADGFTVDLKFVEAADEALRAVLAGAADAYIGSLPTMITAVQNTQAPIKLVAVNAQATDYVVVAKNDVKNLDDLAGKNVGVNTPGSAGDTIMKLAMDNEGFNVDAANYIVIGGTSARVAALQAGQIDATVAHLASAQAAIATGDFKSLLNCGPALGRYLQSGLMLSDAYIAKDPAVVQRAVNALIDAERWAATDKDGYLELSSGLDTETSDDAKSKAYDDFVNIEFFGVDGGLDEDGVDNWLETSVKAGDLPSDYPAKKEWLDDSFVKAYLDANGTF